MASGAVHLYEVARPEVLDPRGVASLPAPRWTEVSKGGSAIVIILGFRPLETCTEGPPAFRPKPAQPLVHLQQRCETTAVAAEAADRAAGRGRAETGGMRSCRGVAVGKDRGNLGDRRQGLRSVYLRAEGTNQLASLRSFLGSSVKAVGG